MTVAWAPEFIVNTTTSGGVSAIQEDSELAALADGGFVAVWTDRSDVDTIRAQVFNADGSHRGAEILIDQAGSGAGTRPSVIGLAGGGFAIGWTESAGTPSNSASDGSESAVLLQIHEADGSLRSAAQIVNTTTAGRQLAPSLAAMNDGGLAISWEDQSPGQASPAARLRLYQADGTAKSAEIAVHGGPKDFNGDTRVITLTDGKLVVAWRDSGTHPADTDPAAVHAQVFNADGTAFAGEFVANTSTRGIQWEPGLTALPDGRFIAVYTDFSLANSPNIRGQLWETAVNSNGDPEVRQVGTSFAVNEAAGGFQSVADIATLADGSVVVVWEDDSGAFGDTSSRAIVARLLAADGTPLGPSFLVNHLTANAQEEPSVTVLGDGRFVISWTDASFGAGPASGVDIRAMIFDPREMGITLPALTPGLYAGPLHWIGTDFADAMTGRNGGDLLEGGGAMIRFWGAAATIPCRAARAMTALSAAASPICSRAARAMTCCSAAISGAIRATRSWGARAMTGWVAASAMTAFMAAMAPTR